MFLETVNIKINHIVQGLNTKKPNHERKLICDTPANTLCLLTKKSITSKNKEGGVAFAKKGEGK